MIIVRSNPRLAIVIVKLWTLVRREKPKGWTMGRRNKQRVREIKAGIRLPFRQQAEPIPSELTSEQRLATLGLLSVRPKLPSKTLQDKKRGGRTALRKESIG